MATHLYLLHAFSPLHCGTGQAVHGIDLPIARERPTGIPLVPGSSLKGVLRASTSGYESGEGAAKDIHLAAFGPDTANAADYAGAVQFSDANLLFLPVRSVRGTFAWVTSPYQLRRLHRDLLEAGLSWKVPLDKEPHDEECLVAEERLVVKGGPGDRVVFEDFDFQPTKSKELREFARQVGRALHGEGAGEGAVEHFVQRVAVVSDDVMQVLQRVGMEVTARIRIDNKTKTVSQGALWTEEALPTESILAGVSSVTPVERGKLARYDQKKLMGHIGELCAKGIQLGGKASVGRGLCRVKVL